MSWKALANLCFFFIFVISCGQFQFSGSQFGDDPEQIQRFEHEGGDDNSTQMGAAVMGSPQELIAQGIPGSEEQAGVVEIYNRSQSGMEKLAEIRAHDGHAGDQFGKVVILGTTLMAVGAPGHNDSKGAVYLYRYSRESREWGFFYKVNSLDLEEASRFGYTLSALGNHLVIGAPGAQNNEDQESCVYVFSYVNNSWRLTKLDCSQNSHSSLLFGSKFEIQKDKIIVYENVLGDNGYISQIEHEYIYDLSIQKWISVEDQNNESDDSGQQSSVLPPSGTGASASGSQSQSRGGGSAAGGSTAPPSSSGAGSGQQQNSAQNSSSGDIVTRTVPCKQEGNFHTCAYTGPTPERVQFRHCDESGNDWGHWVKSLDIYHKKEASGKGSTSQISIGDFEPWSYLGPSKRYIFDNKIVLTGATGSFLIKVCEARYTYTNTASSQNTINQNQDTLPLNSDDSCNEGYTEDSGACRLIQKIQCYKNKYNGISCDLKGEVPERVKVHQKDQYLGSVSSDWLKTGDYYTVEGNGHYNSGYVHINGLNSGTAEVINNSKGKIIIMPMFNSYGGASTYEISYFPSGQSVNADMLPLNVDGSCDEGYVKDSSSCRRLKNSKCQYTSLAKWTCPYEGEKPTQVQFKFCDNVRDDWSQFFTHGANKYLFLPNNQFLHISYVGIYEDDSKIHFSTGESTYFGKVCEARYY